MRPGGIEITDRALAYCGLHPGARVLDVGCGLGATLRHIIAKHGVKGFGIDISTALLRYAHESDSEILFAQARGESLPFANESLDVILAECTLSLMEAKLILQECARTLKFSGSLVLSDIYSRNENGIEALRKLPPGTCLSTAMAQGQIIEKLECCGFRVSIWQDCSEKLKEFSIGTLTTASAVDPFDLLIAASRAKLGYYFLVAQKGPARLIGQANEVFVRQPKYQQAGS